jgi:AraC-like DNA-binding protein
MPTVPKTQLYQWPDKMLFVGPLGEVGAHRHGANAWCHALEGELGYAAGRGAGWSRADGARIALGCEHRLHGGDRPVAVLYLHPEFDTPQAPGTQLLSERAPPLLHDAYRSGSLSAAALAELGAGLDRIVYGGREPGAGRASPAVGAAVACLKHRLAHNLTLPEVAAAAGLSPGRLLHRFSAELGLAPRRFRLWHRLVRSLDLAVAGGSLTAAALDAGFASPAHLSSAFRASFGLAPSAVLRAPGLEMHRCTATVSP